MLRRFALLLGIVAFVLVPSIAKADQFNGHRVCPPGYHFNGHGLCVRIKNWHPEHPRHPVHPVHPVHPQHPGHGHDKDH